MCGLAGAHTLDWLFLKKDPRSWIAPLIAAVVQLGWHLYIGLYLDAGEYPSVWGIHGYKLIISA